ncbi:uncharacterized protein LOC124453306 isoform X2 [Xenia sp. Carnegie-2017]|uniref:uncharacterized protein LOC124453306 isoform X2 n=1 Tax=Xenia sp. Carnegie-2017 TaxID=2897299 RepID=UPI001F04BC92|nr:uncharacterized protein LOC124453306 isoform X2 [Xenia sp. Carnegie-2017]
MSVDSKGDTPVKVEYIEAQSAVAMRNENIATNASKMTRQEAYVELKPSADIDDSPSPQKNETLVEPGDMVTHRTTKTTQTSPVTPPSAGSPSNPLIPNKFQFDPNLSYAEKVAHEMIVTEKMYLENLKQIIDGFLGPVVNASDINVSKEDIQDLFINVEDIYQFNRILLQDMENCNYDPVKLAKCFVLKQVGFEIYTKYCTHYPRSMEVLFEWNQREDTANFIQQQQELLGHTLPLCSFLLKPVQRILKYHLLLGNIAKHFKQAEDEEGYEIIQKALSAMTSVAKHINDMKRKHEDAVHLQEIQSILLDYEGPNLSSFGSVVLEGSFRLHGAKTGRYLLVFEKALLITKRRSDGTFAWKATVMFSNMMLADSVLREPLTFQVFRFDDRKIGYTFVARDLETKRVWLLELKKRLLDSYTANVPMKAKQIILGNSREEKEKENTEREIPRHTTNHKGENQQRTLIKDNYSSNKKAVNRHAENERRKTKDEDSLEEKTKPSSDSRNPLRRGLRVFKRRRPVKEVTRVSWSSDENNDNAVDDSKNIVIHEKINIEERKSNDDSSLELQNEESKDPTNVETYNSSLPVSSIAQNEDIQVQFQSDDDGLRIARDDNLPTKKRRVTQEKFLRRCSMPATNYYESLMYEEGPFMTLARTLSMSRFNEKFLERETIDPASYAKDLEKYDLVEPFSRAKVKLTDPIIYEGQLHVNDVMDEHHSDVIIPDSHSSVNQTMKHVSQAFSDISTTFSQDKSPYSSFDELTSDLSPGDFTPDNLTLGDNSAESLSRDVKSTKKELPVNVNGEEWIENNGVKFDRSEEGTAQSERSSYVETLSDVSFDEPADNIWQQRTYQRVFTLKKSFSEENLVSKCSMDGDNNGENMTSKSCSHVTVMRSSSMDRYRKPQHSCRPFNFSVTPKKKIVIRDSKWTIDQQQSQNSPEISVVKGSRSLRRRRKHRSTTKSREREESVQNVARSTAVLNVPDYTAMNNYETSSLAPDNQSTEKNSMRPRIMHINLRKRSDSSLIPFKDENETFLDNNDNVEVFQMHPPVTNVTVNLRKKRETRSNENIKDSFDVSDPPASINYTSTQPPRVEIWNSEQRETVVRDKVKTNGSFSSSVARDKVKTNGSSSSSVARDKVKTNGSFSSSVARDKVKTNGSFSSSVARDKVKTNGSFRPQLHVTR